MFPGESVVRLTSFFPKEFFDLNRFSHPLKHSLKIATKSEDKSKLLSVLFRHYFLFYNYLSKRQTRWLVSWLALNIMCSIHTIINCKQHRIYIRILLHKKYFWVEGVWFCPKCDQHWCLRLVTFQMKLGTYNLLSK